MIDWSAAALAAARANATYVIDQGAAKYAFEELGDTFVDQYKDRTHQAVLSVDGAGRPQLSISGTRPLSWNSLDVFADIDLTPVCATGWTAKNGLIASGALEGMRDLWEWIDYTIDSSAVLAVQGHSLGAARTHLTPLFRPPERVGLLHSFESPKFADAAYYAQFAPALAGIVCTLHGRDPWAAWPWTKTPFSRPQVPHLWLQTTGGMCVANQIDPATWLGGSILDYHDHDIGPIAGALAMIARNTATAQAAGQFGNREATEAP